MLTQDYPPSRTEQTPEPTDAPPHRHPDAGIFELLRRLLDDIVIWISLEGELARAEIAGKLRAALRGLAIGAAGAVILICGGIAILLAIGFAVSGALQIAGVNPAFSHALGFLLSGVLGAIAGWILLRQARAALSPSNLTPSRTTAMLRQAATWLGDKLHPHPRNDHEQTPPSP